MAKVFESEVSAALRRLEPAYWHKCPDHPHAIPDKVDFLGVFKAIGMGIEAKETSNRDTLQGRDLTPNQRSCLQQIYEADGFAAVVVNFDRQRGVTGRVGFCFAWRYIDLPPLDGQFSVFDGNAVLIPRLPGTWAIDTWIRRSL